MLALKESKINLCKQWMPLNVITLGQVETDNMNDNNNLLFSFMPKWDL
jgi:hypothetical protein